MYPAPIDGYLRPASIEEALAAIGSGDGATPIAGGQSLMQAIKVRLVQPGVLVDLQDVAGLKGVEVSGDGVTIGAMTRFVELAADDRLAPAYAAINDAAAHVGDRQVRNRGTIGGSLCWNYVAACMPAVALGLGASMNLRSGGGSRTLAADEFIDTPLETARADDELLVSVSLPAMAGGAGSAYRKWALVSDGLPVIGVCVSLEVADGRCASARVAVGGLADGPTRSAAGEAALSRRRPRRRGRHRGSHGRGRGRDRDPGGPLGRQRLPQAAHPLARRRGGTANGLRARRRLTAGTEVQRRLKLPEETAR